MPVAWPCSRYRQGDHYVRPPRMGRHAGARGQEGSRSQRLGQVEDSLPGTGTHLQECSSAPLLKGPHEEPSCRHLR